MTLGAIATGLLLGAAPALVCPPGTEHRGAAPLEGYEEWCETPKVDERPAKREGPARTYYDDGQVWVESAYHDGRLHGPYVEYHRGGRKAREGGYEQGDRTGRWTFFFEDGTKEEESGWTKGFPDGPFSNYWRNGKLRTEGRRCRGVQCGKWRSFDEDGRLTGSVEYGEQRAEP